MGLHDEHDFSRADLTISQVTVDPIAAWAGGNLTVSFSVDNIGNNGARASSTYVYLSTDSIITSSDILLGAIATETILSGTSLLKQGVFALPSNLSGTFYIGIVTDGANQVKERSETNNTSNPLQISIGSGPPALPDLTVSGLTGVPASMIQGAGATIAYTIANGGTTSAAASTSSFYLSTDATITTSDLLLTTDAVPLIAAGASLAGRSVSFTLPGNVAPGNYYIGVLADSGTQITEVIESNNTTSVAIQVAASLPDLTVSGLNGVPASMIQGAGATIAYTIANGGTTSSAASTSSFYLSTDATITTSDLLLTTDAVPLIAAGASLAGRSVSFTLPGNVTPGNYFLGVLADSDAQITESNEGNNTTSVAIQVAASRPDLTVSGLTGVPASMIQGAGATIAYTIANGGTASAAASTSSFYLSTDATITTSDLLLTTDAVPLIAAGASLAGRSVSFTLPGNVTPGNYYIGVLADSGAQITESNEGNNTTSVAIQVGASLPDLTVSGLSGVPASMIQGAGATIAYTIGNGGTNSAGASTSSFYLSTDATITTSDLLLTTDAVPLIAAGASLPGRSVSFTLPGNVAPGNYFIGVIADSGALITESNENNNTTSVAMQVGASLPDLTVSGLTGVPASMIQGAGATISYTIGNGGTNSAAASTSSFYLSTDATITTSDLLLTTDAVPSIVAGASLPGRSVSFTLPGTVAPGNYFVGVLADSGALITESNENNNTTSVAIQVAASRPDLTVSGLSGVPASMLQGAGATIAYTIANGGTASAAASTSSFYLSTDATITASDLLLTTDAVPSIVAGASLPGRGVSFTLPGTVAPGNYYVGVLADSGALVTESNENNNTTSVAMQVGASLPDLTVSGLSGVPASMIPGAGATIAYTIGNGGTTSAAASTSSFYLSTDATITTSDLLLTADAVPSISAGASLPGRSVSFTLPGNVVPGTYYLGVLADSGAQITEANENNNTVAAQIVVPLFTEFADTVTFTTAAVNQHALGGDDLVTGSEQADSIYGDGGNDTLTGRGGDDLLDGGAENDQLFGGLGSDDLYGGIGDDNLYVTGNDRILEGGAGYDQVIVIDTVGVSIAVGSGVEYVIGDTGNDVVSAETLTTQVSMNGGAGNDTLTGGTRGDWMVGGAGNDEIYGGLGSDSLFGGDGDDKLYILGSDGRIEGGAGNDQVIVLDTAGVSITLGSGVESVVGNNGNDVVSAEGLTTQVSMNGGAGNDTLTGGTRGDWINGGAGNDEIYGGLGSDSLFGGDGDDKLYILGSDARIEGGAGNDQAIVVDTAGVSIVLGMGTESAAGNSGNDAIDGSGLSTSLTLGGAGGDDTLRGGTAADVISGSTGADTIFGNSGDDQIFGDDGNDALYGGGGADQLTLGSGNDTCFLEDGSGNDVVLGFANGLDHFDFSLHTTVNAFSDLTIVSDRSSPNATIFFNGGQVLVIGGAGLIDASDFVF